MRRAARPRLRPGKAWPRSANRPQPRPGCAKPRPAPYPCPGPGDRRRTAGADWSPLSPDSGRMRGRGRRGARCGRGRSSGIREFRGRSPGPRRRPASGCDTSNLVIESLRPSPQSAAVGHSMRRRPRNWVGVLPGLLVQPERCEGTKKFARALVLTSLLSPSRRLPGRRHPFPTARRGRTTTSAGTARTLGPRYRVAGARPHHRRRCPGGSVRDPAAPRREWSFASRPRV